MIIKSDANYYGLPEIDQGNKGFFNNLRRRNSKLYNWRVLRELPRRSYPILDNLHKVPKWVWKREDLVVEKFLPEMDGNLYVLRIWLFFGEREYGAKLWSKNPIVKASNFTSYEYIDDVPDSLRAIRKSIGIEFGKIDYVLVDGKAIVLDINKTPTSSAPVNRVSPNTVKLAEGLDSFARQ